MTSASDNPRVHHGAYGTCRDPTNRLLLVHLASGLDKGQWALPGGEIEWGEHPDAALLRKMEEETGLVDIDSFRVTTVYSHTYPWSAKTAADPHGRMRGRLGLAAILIRVYLAGSDPAKATPRPVQAARPSS